jgi:hypothetical protein
LPSAKGRIVRHGPVQVGHPQQAGHHAGRLQQGQLEQHLDRQAKLDRRVGEHRRPTRTAVMRREPGHLLVQPDQQRPALAECGSVTGPVRRPVTGGCRLVHAACLTAWIHDVNPPRSEVGNNAAANKAATQD